MRTKPTIHLTQHTPIIHFQYEQSGATLRATELKPKFDRFLKKVDSSLPFKKHHNDHYSLDYKVKILSKGNQIIEFEKYPPLYFGNQKGSKPKQKVISKDVTIEFFSFDQKILKAIDKHFEAFLANTNFGTRQSKGYGCFYLKDKKFDPSLIDTKIHTKVYSFESTLQNYENDIKNFYTLIRSGINKVGRDKQTIFYAKSLMYLYFDQMGMIWDKKAIKMHFLNGVKDTSNQYIVRDLLGLSSFQNWRSYKFNVKKFNPKISRFKSPVIFKPIHENGKVTVYFWSKKFITSAKIHEMLNQPFTISGKGSFTIKTPARFDAEDFLTFVKNIDLQQHVTKPSYRNTQEFRSLANIFNSLKVYS